VREGHYAAEPSPDPGPDIAVDRIADLLTLDPSRFSR
jgi:hypothetical protein